MAEAAEIRMRPAAMFGWVLPAELVVAAAGAYPTWRLGGAGALAAETAAAVIVLAAMSAGAGVVVWRGSRGPAAAAMGFMISASVRVMLCVALTVVAWRWIALDPAPLMVWVAVFYLVGLAGETIWLIRAISPRRRLVALGGADRHEKELP